MPGELAKAVCAVMAEVRNVEKGGYNKQGGYKFTGDADLLRALQPSMSKHGLAIVPIKVERTATTHTTGRGTQMDRADVLVTYRLMHTGGEHIDIQAPGTGMDSLDKAPYKAMTGAFKYALRQTFAVPTGDDPENDGQKPAPPRKDPQAGKAPEWRALMAAISAADLKYDDYRNWAEAKDWGRVDTWGVDGWAKAAQNIERDAPDVRAFLEA